jgi:hypothetical protein
MIPKMNKTAAKNLITSIIQVNHTRDNGSRIMLTPKPATAAISAA